MACRKPNMRASWVSPLDRTNLERENFDQTMVVNFMPRYFLHTRNSPQRLEDFEGSELPDAAAAQDEPVGSALDLICDRLQGGWFQRGRKIFGSSIEVTDES